MGRQSCLLRHWPWNQSSVRSSVPVLSLSSHRAYSFPHKMPTTGTRIRDPFVIPRDNIMISGNNGSSEQRQPTHHWRLLYVVVQLWRTSSKNSKNIIITLVVECGILHLSNSQMFCPWGSRSVRLLFDVLCSLKQQRDVETETTS